MSLNFCIDVVELVCSNLYTNFFLHSKFVHEFLKFHVRISFFFSGKWPLSLPVLLCNLPQENLLTLVLMPTTVSVGSEHLLVHSCIFQQLKGPLQTMRFLVHCFSRASSYEGASKCLSCRSFCFHPYSRHQDQPIKSI